MTPLGRKLYFSCILPVAVPLRENVNKEGDVKVYFFWKSLEQCQQKYLEPYVHKCLTELEEKVVIQFNIGYLII